MSVRKIFNIIISSLTLYLFINMFIDHVPGLSIWKLSASYGVFLLLSYIGIITVYLLNTFGIFKDKWMGYINYVTGFVALFYMTTLFASIKETAAGIWLGTIVSLAVLVLSILWNFMSDKAPVKNTPPKGGKITGYDPQTGEPIFAKPKGFNPQTGEPIYE